MKKQSNGINRKDFFKQSTILTAGAFLLGSGGTSLFAAHPAREETAIPGVTLNNGESMPMLGFGTNTLNGDLCTQCVSHALASGYRLIDTAKVYGNEEAVGEALGSSSVSREEMFITSKLWVDDMGYETTPNGLQVTLDKLGLDYLDLYLIHRPRGDVKGSWKAMEELYEAGKIKSIGVSNFTRPQIEELLEYASVKPAVNQIETNVFFQQYAMHTYLESANIQSEGWSPFAAGKRDIFNNPTLLEIAAKHNKTVAQVCLRWNYQRGIIAIPRSSQKVHIEENLRIFDFELDAEDFEIIRAMDENTTQFPEWE